MPYDAGKGMQPTGIPKKLPESQCYLAVQALGQAR